MATDQLIYVAHDKMSMYLRTADDGNAVCCQIAQQKNLIVVAHVDLTLTHVVRVGKFVSRGVLHALQCHPLNY